MATPLSPVRGEIIKHDDRHHSRKSLDLAALLCSRVCHDLISPAGAIVNGLEVLEESKDEETRIFALELIKKSANTASARLQFCRIAFGAAGSAGAQVDLGDAENVARGFIEDEKIKLAWNLPRQLLPKNRVKLLLNLLLVAAQSIPRGGVLSVDGDGPAEAMTFRIAGARSQFPHSAGIAGAPRRRSRGRRHRCPSDSAVLCRDAGACERARVTIEAEADTIVVAAR